MSSTSWVSARPTAAIGDRGHRLLEWLSAGRWQGHESVLGAARALHGAPECADVRQTGRLAPAVHQGRRVRPARALLGRGADEAASLLATTTSVVTCSRLWLSRPDWYLARMLLRGRAREAASGGTGGGEPANLGNSQKMKEESHRALKCAGTKAVWYHRCRSEDFGPCRFVAEKHLARHQNPMHFGSSQASPRARSAACSTHEVCSHA